MRITARDKAYQRRIAGERIKILIELARRNKKYSRRYVELAWRLARKYRVKLGKVKYTFCRKCFTLWTPETLRVRIVHNPYPRVVYKCLVCGAEYSIPIRNVNKKRKSGSASEGQGG